MTESKLSGEQIAALMAQGFWPLEIARIMPPAPMTTVIDINGERWVKKENPGLQKMLDEYLGRTDKTTDPG